jgi:hypothetical protein
MPSGGGRVRRKTVIVFTNTTDAEAHGVHGGKLNQFSVTSVLNDSVVFAGRGCAEVRAGRRSPRSHHRGGEKRLELVTEWHRAQHAAIVEHGIERRMRVAAKVE